MKTQPDWFGSAWMHRTTTLDARVPATKAAASMADVPSVQTHMLGRARSKAGQGREGTRKRERGRDVRAGSKVGIPTRTNRGDPHFASYPLDEDEALARYASAAVHPWGDRLAGAWGKDGSGLCVHGEWGAAAATGMDGMDGREERSALESAMEDGGWAPPIPPRYPSSARPLPRAFIRVSSSACPPPHAPIHVPGSAHASEGRAAHRRIPNSLARLNACE